MMMTVMVVSSDVFLILHKIIKSVTAITISVIIVFRQLLHVILTAIKGD